MDPNSKNQPIQQAQQAPGSQIQQPTPVSVPVGGTEGAPANVTPIEVTTAAVSPENANIVVEQGPEFAQAPSVPQSVGQVGVVGHPSSDVHPDLTVEVKKAQSEYVPVWKTVQEAELVRKESKPDQGIYGMATEFIKNIKRKISGSAQPSQV